jgi:hypothetical protein
VGTEKFDHIKPAVRGSGDHIKPMISAWGDPYETTGRVNTGHGNIQPAGLFSTAPYVPPTPKTEHCLGKNNTCTNTEHLRNSGYCPGCDIQRILRERREAAD